MTSKLIPSTPESISISQETTHFTSFTGTRNEISLSTSPDTFFPTDSTSGTSNLDLTTRQTTEFVTTTDKSTSIIEETTSEAFMTSTLINEITYFTELSKTSTFIGSTQIFQTYSMSILPTSGSSTSEFMTSKTQPTDISVEATSLTSYSNGISLSTSTTYIPLNLFEDFCPDTTKTISCASVGGKVQLTDAFIGISSATPPVCVYNKLDILI